MSTLTVEFCGEELVVGPDEVFTIGREGDLVVDEDNPYLHRRVVELRHDAGFWWIVNVGTRLSVTVSGDAGTLQSWIGPGSRLPVVMASQAIVFTAGDTVYEITIVCDEPVYSGTPSTPEESGDATLGAVELTPSQLRLVLALAEPVLRRRGAGPGEVPTNAAAAERLGVPITTFNRKLDNVCEKFARNGVKGLHGGAGQLATSRRSRLVEYAVSAGIVRAEHLPLLDLSAPDAGQERAASAPPDVS
ncbi:hypothetical protein [Aeromicrobium chenweiae]|uniref:Uncharacterized protein n=1 Tax=Aeromicrobium chenweiae TaxID=2079793 RepID=A0A2S0WPW1_9ACTN|nr:hypothetical protein [Aeromicrobium chenweiae]AWB93356.1 hypothetical protein C3E78_14675 [Aeromicrobium chenweiae]TGN34346.1 hypothetical protein E4L97_04700 [Aeromicrobium chenweiae]